MINTSNYFEFEPSEMANAATFGYFVNGYIVQRLKEVFGQAVQYVEFVSGNNTYTGFTLPRSNGIPSNYCIIFEVDRSTEITQTTTIGTYYNDNGNYVRAANDQSFEIISKAGGSYNRKTVRWDNANPRRIDQYPFVIRIDTLNTMTLYAYANGNYNNDSAKEYWVDPSSMIFTDNRGEEMYIGLNGVSTAIMQYFDTVYDQLQITFEKPSKSLSRAIRLINVGIADSITPLFYASNNYAAANGIWNSRTSNESTYISLYKNVTYVNDALVVDGDTYGALFTNINGTVLFIKQEDDDV